MNEFLSQSLDLGHHHVTVLQVLEAFAVLVLARIGLAIARRGLNRAAQPKPWMRAKRSSWGVC